MSSNEPERCSRCTVGLLATACQTAYMLRDDNLINLSGDPWHEQTLIGFAEHGYAITRSVAPLSAGGNGQTPLAALCLEPQDLQSPIIVSFRGTNTGSDFLSDLRLGTVGVVETEFRNAAFEFYESVRNEHPDREIILTGHSLGGHLAQYVGTKAYNTDVDLQKNPLIHIRTFNTAPINTRHSLVFENHPDLLTQFVNYRLSSDAISDLPLQKYYGKTFVFHCDRGVLDSHSMETLVQYLPATILNQCIGSCMESDSKHNRLLELTEGNRHTYQCRVESQFFSTCRAGARNLQNMQTALPDIFETLLAKQYAQAIPKLRTLREQMDGKVSTGMIRDLLHETEQASRRHERRRQAGD